MYSKLNDKIKQYFIHVYISQLAPNKQKECGMDIANLTIL